MVGFVFAGAADSHLNQHGGDRRQNNHGQRSDRIAVLVVRAAEEGQKLRGIGDHAGHHGGDRRSQDVAVFDMGKLMAQHAGQLPVIQHVHDAGRDSDSRVIRIAPRGKGIWHIRVYDADFRHGKISICCQLFHQSIELRSVFAGDFLSAIGAQNHRITKPVRKDIHTKR